MEIQNNYSLQSLNTFGIDSKATRFCEFTDINELRQLADQGLLSKDTIILGGGSNILFTSDFQGLIAKNRITGIEIVDKTADKVWIRSGSGVIWHDLVEYCIQNDFGGIENLSLIPGTVGAAPMQNIGAYGVELKSVFSELEAIDRSNGELKNFNNKECEFDYRESIFKTTARDKYVITNVTICLTIGSHIFNTDYGAIKQVLDKTGISNPTIRDISEAVIKIRRSKLPDPSIIGNAGSFFKNPIVDKLDFEQLKMEFPEIRSYEAGIDHFKIPAGWLIEQCGWKGKRIGNIGVHKDQALVIVNFGGGSGKDILKLAADIKTSVRDTFGIELHPEVNIV